MLSDRSALGPYLVQAPIKLFIASLRMKQISSESQKLEAFIQALPIHSISVNRSFWRVYVVFASSSSRGDGLVSVTIYYQLNMILHCVLPVVVLWMLARVENRS